MFSKRGIILKYCIRAVQKSVTLIPGANIKEREDYDISHPIFTFFLVRATMHQLMSFQK